MIIKKLLQSLVLALGLSTAVCFAQQVIGAGASSIYPALSQWVQSYAAATSTQINYESTGSGNGLRQLDNHTVDFAATDMPLTAAELSQKNLLQFPVLTGGIVPVVNIAGIQNNQLILNGQVLADIYMGKVSKWNDPEITALNPGLSLPNALIIAVHRSDSSGTTYNFTNYLAAQSPAWSAQVGADTIVAWPGFGLGVKTNAGIATQVENMPNSLGYIAYSYAVQNHMQMVKMQNQAGKIVTASSESFAQAVKNPDSATSWPMLETAYIVLPNHSSAYARNSAQVLKFFEWVYKNGSPAAEQLGYIALTKPEYEPIEKQWNTQLPDWNK